MVEDVVVVVVEEENVVGAVISIFTFVEWSLDLPALRYSFHFV